MLKSLFINNVVLIDKLDLNFSRGLTVFSGETGAGKSVLLDSIALVLGSRSDVKMIRTGADKLSVTAVFEINNKNTALNLILEENGIEFEDELIIRRILTADGKSKIFLNDEPVGLKLLKEIGGYLAEIHGQFDNQGLLNESTHINVLDAYGDYKELLNKTSASFQKYKDMQKKLSQALDLYEKTVRDEEIFLHYKKELEEANVYTGEEKELTLKRAEMMNASKILENFGTAYQALKSESVTGNIRHALSAIDKVNRLTENKYQDISQNLDSVLIEIEEALSKIESTSADINLNKNEINAVEERLFALKDLARKHSCTIDDLPEVLNKITKNLENIQKNNEDIINYKKELIKLKDDYVKNALELHELRVKTGEILSLNVQKELEFLKMNKAEFKVCVEKEPDENWNIKGMDKVCFEVKTNAGQPFGELSKIASGGELARFMLALKVNLCSKTGAKTLVFDEIDTGIGGSTAESVGKKLFELSKDVQVFVVTHSPQVASFSTTHFKVSKQTQDNITTTKVELLSCEQKKEEIARMLSGEKISQEARAAADKLISKTA